MGLCEGCKQIQDIVFTSDETGLSYCAVCVTSLPLPSDVLARLFLLATIPYKIGDRVEVRQAGEVYEGKGVVRRVSTTFDAETGGTPVFPTFLVEFEEKEDQDVPDQDWYPEICLKKVDSD